MRIDLIPVALMLSNVVAAAAALFAAFGFIAATMMGMYATAFTAFGAAVMLVGYIVVVTALVDAAQVL